MIKATVFFIPEVIIEAKWAADNGRETCVFPTQEEAFNFAYKRWGVTRDEIRVENKYV